ncbi:MAG: sulfotransferase [Pseudomonadales bacterium]|nr:sulfotransferase [Pseudomonadales bacterium]MBP9033017.1 sulfotransferase [Pseudomonadales bacterium]
MSDGVAGGGEYEVPDVELSEQALLATARHNTGLGDFGDEADWKEGFTRLLASLNDESRLNRVGRLIAFGELLRHLENRLRVTGDIHRNPSILEVEIRKPVFVVGLPRTGSTILHDLLARDPDNRVPITWETQYMSPPAEAATYDTDPRIAVCEAHFERTSRALIPEFQAIHEMGALLAQECLMLNAFDFRSVIFANQFRIPSYEHWVETVDQTSVYRTHKRLLQYMQWHNPKQRWVLKSTGHLFALDALYAVYPDAQVIMTHRDPLKLIASHCSLVSMACSMGSDQVDKREVGEQWSVSWERAMRNGVDFRRTRPEAATIFDMHFAELAHDPLAMVKRIYAHFDLPLSAVAEARMRDFIEHNPKERHGVHRYTLQEFGLDPERERERYRFYQDYFGVANEG